MVDVTGDFQTFLMGAFGKEFDDLFDNLTQVEVGVFQFQFACFNFGKVEDFVDDFK